METFTKLKPVLWLVVGGLLLSVTSIIVWYNTNEGHDGFAVGWVTTVATSTITVADPFEVNTKVIIAGETQIEDRGETLSLADLTDTMFVQVSGTPTSTASIIAGLILVTEPPKKKQR